MKASSKSRSQKSNTSRKADFVRISRSSVLYLAEIAFSGIDSNCFVSGRTKAEQYNNALVETVGDETRSRYIVEDATHYRAAMIALGKGKGLREPHKIAAEALRKAG